MNLDDIRKRIAVTVTNCWEWNGAHLASGYGSVRFEGRNRVVHRVMWEAAGGEIPEGMQLDHLCRNRGCCNPAHLQVVTQAENLRRGNGFSGINSRKTHCPRNHELTDENTYISPKGYRECRSCRRANRRRHYLKERAA